MLWTRDPLAVLTLVLTFCMAGCQGQIGERPEDGPPLVVVSIFPVGDIVQNLVGDAARVEVLLPPGASPATFDVTPRQVSDLSQAVLFVMVHDGLDGWVSHLPGAASGAAPVIQISDGIELLHDNEGEAETEEDSQDHEHAGPSQAHEGGNPHVWLDPLLVRDQVLPILVEGLSSVLPASGEVIEDRAAGLATSLTELDQEIRLALQPLRQRAFIATHSAWTYFAERYGLEQAGVIHAHPGQDPSARELAHLLEVAEDRGLTCIFTEPQLGEAAVRALASELGLPTCMLDPLGGPGEEGRQDYLGLLRFNTQKLVEGLGGSGP
jgi:zinc transport system substrate-binding protein